jgi:hypothetical protein
MFRIYRSPSICALVWMFVFAALAWAVSRDREQQGNLRTLDLVESRDKAYGAVPGGLCDTYALITGFCADYKNICGLQTKAQCAAGTTCVSCTTNLQDTVCDYSSKPWTFICTTKSNAGACGNFYLQTTCTWNGNDNKCECWSASGETGAACSQEQDSVSTQENGQTCVTVQ